MCSRYCSRYWGDCTHKTDKESALLEFTDQGPKKKKKHKHKHAFLGIQRKQAMGRNINQDSVGTLVRVVRENPSQLLLS